MSHKLKCTSMHVKSIFAATMIAAVTGASGMVHAGYVDGDYTVESGEIIAPDVAIESSERLTAVGANDKDTIVTVKDDGTLYIKAGSDDFDNGIARAYALASENNKNLTLIGNTDVDIDVDSQRVDAIRANGGNITVRGDLQVSAKSKENESYGLDVWSGAEFDFEGNVLNIVSSSESKQAFGIYVNGGSAEIQANSVSLTAESVSSSNSNKRSSGLEIINGDVSISASDSVEITAKTKEEHVYGIYSQYGSGSIISDNSSGINILVESKATNKSITEGIYVYRSTIELKGKTNLKVIGATNSLDEKNNVTYGVDATSDLKDPDLGLYYEPGIVKFWDDTVIDVEAGNQVLAIRPTWGSQIIFNGINNKVQAHSVNERAYGIRATHNGSVDVNGNIDLDVSTDSTNGDFGAYGIYVEDWNENNLVSGRVNVTGLAKVKATSKTADAYGIYASALGTNADSSTDGDITITNLDAYVTSEEGSAYGIKSKGASAYVNISDNALITVESENEAFAVFSEEASTISIGSGEESSRDGVIQIFGNIKTDETSNISIGNGSNEVLISGAITDGSTSDGAAGITLNLSDNSVWHVTGNSTLGTLLGTGKVRLAAKRDSATGEVSLGSTLTIDQVEEGRLNLGFDGITADHINADGLAQLVKGDGIGVSADIVASVDEGGVFGELVYDSATGTTYQKANTMLSAFSGVNVTHLLQWRHEMSDLTKRMGELRMSPEGVGAWARVYGSEQKYGVQSVETKNSSVQVGADYDLGSGWKVGAAFSYTDSTSKMDNGNADGDMYGLAVYGSWFKGDGQFLDLIAKYSRLSNDFTAGEMSGSYDNNALSISAEYGWHWKLNELSFVEPQVEVTYGRIMGDDFTASNGVKVSQDDTDSLIGRIGLRGGLYFPNNKGTIYAHVSALHDFEGETGFRASNATASDYFSEDLGDMWCEFGLGANFNLSDTTYTYVDLQKSTGGDVQESWRWNIGLRTVF